MEYLSITTLQPFHLTTGKKKPHGRSTEDVKFMYVCVPGEKGPVNKTRTEIIKHYKTMNVH